MSGVLGVTHADVVVGAREHLAFVLGEKDLSAMEFGHVACAGLAWDICKMATGLVPAQSTVTPGQATQVGPSWDAEWSHNSHGVLLRLLGSRVPR